MEQRIAENRCPLDGEPLRVGDYLKGAHVTGSLPCEFRFSAKVGY